MNVVKGDLRVNAEQSARLRSQLILASAAPEIRRDPVLQRLVRRAGHQLQLTGDGAAVARQIGIDLGYYLFCHDYQMPRAAYNLLAVTQLIVTTTAQPGQLMGLARGDNPRRDEKFQKTGL